MEVSGIYHNAKSNKYTLILLANWPDKTCRKYCGSYKSLKQAIDMRTEIDKKYGIVKSKRKQYKRKRELNKACGKTEDNPKVQPPNMGNTQPINVPTFPKLEDTRDSIIDDAFKKKLKYELRNIKILADYL